jgi:apolipoprotein N-acyltransferase
MSRLDLVLRLLAAVLSGVGLFCVSPPIGAAWLQWFIWVPVLWALEPGQGRRNALIGYVAGWVGIFLCFFWLVDTVVIFSSLPWAAAAAVHLIFATAFAVPYAIFFGSVPWLRERLGPWWMLAMPAIGVACEKLYPSLFPYYQGSPQYRTELVWQLSSVTGVMGVSFLVFLTNGVLVEQLYRRREGRGPDLRPVGGAAAFFLTNLAFGALRYPAVEAELAQARVLRVGLIQQGITMEERFRRSELTNLKAWLRLSAQAYKEKPDLLIWPEGSINFNPNSEKTTPALGGKSPKELFEEYVKIGNYDFLVGGGTIDRHEQPVDGHKYTAYNSTYLFTHEQGLTDRYDKMVPLPFGEYVPFSDTFPILRTLIQGPGDFQRGHRPTTFTATDGAGLPYTFSVPICYEAILESAMWRLYLGEKEEPVDLFVNITNDGWFGNTASPHQHAMLAAAQAVQFGRPLVREAYTGINMVVEPHGAILYETQPYVEHAAVREVRLGKVWTLYTAGGWLFPWLCTLGGAGALLLAWRREKAA